MRSENFAAAFRPRPDKCRTRFDIGNRGEVKNIMSNLTVCVNAILPLFILILLGWTLRKLRVVSETGFGALNKLCFKLLIPAMLFYSVYTSDFSKSFSLKSVLFVVIGIVTLEMTVMLIVAKGLKKKGQPGVAITHALCHGNVAVVGLPLITNMFGADGLAEYAIMSAFATLTTNSLLVVLHEMADGNRGSIGKQIRGIVTSPLLIGTALGLVCNLLKVRFPVFLETSIKNIYQCSSPVSLIALGGSFVVTKEKADLRKIAACTGIRCILIPAVLTAAAILLGFRGVTLGAILVIFGCPTAVSAYGFCAGYKCEPAFIAQTIVSTTALSILTMFLWFFLYMQIGLV